MDLRAVGEDFGEIVGDGERLEAETEIAGDGYAVFSDHCYAGAAVWETVLACLLRCWLMRFDRTYGERRGHGGV